MFVRNKLDSFLIAISKKKICPTYFKLCQTYFKICLT